MTDYSIVIAAYQSIDNVQRAIEQAHSNTLPPKEITIIVNHCNDVSDDLVDMIQADSRVTRWVYSSHNMGIATAWNLGMMMSTTDKIVILSDDCSVENNAYETLMAGFSKEDKVGIVGPYGSVMHGQHVAAGWFIAVSKQMVMEIGGYTEFSSPLADEVELTFRARRHGWKTVIVEDYTEHTHTISANEDAVINYLGRDTTPREFQKEGVPRLRAMVAEHIGATK